MRKCIHAYTPIGGAAPPPYFNFSDVGDGEHAELTVRDHAQMVQHENGAYYEPGHHSTIAVHRDELVKLACAILDWARACQAPKSHQPQIDVRELRTLSATSTHLNIASYGTDCTCGARRMLQHNIGCPLRTEQTVGLCVPNAASAFRSAGAAGCLGMEIVGDGPRPG